MDLKKYRDLLATDICDALGQGHVMEMGIQSLLQPAIRIMGPVFTVRCINRSNTYLHRAIYKAPKGSVIVAETDSHDYAVAGGNVCAIAQQNGIEGMVIDGAIRDVGEARELNFPVFARGVFPKPGKKGSEGENQTTITCGKLTVNPGDFIVADEEGIVVIPKADTEAVLEEALVKKNKAESTSLDAWRENHYKKISALVDM